jgi:hypothetical protein
LQQQGGPLFSPSRSHDRLLVGDGDTIICEACITLAVARIAEARGAVGYPQPQRCCLVSAPPGAQQGKALVARCGGSNMPRNHEIDEIDVEVIWERICEIAASRAGISPERAEAILDDNGFDAYGHTGLVEAVEVVGWAIGDLPSALQ